VYKVFGYFKREADAGMPVHNVAKERECTPEARHSITCVYQIIISEGNVAICISVCAPSAFVRAGHFSIEVADCVRV
jgi:hypothetical protein